MKKAFLDAYNKELGILYERSKEFAQDYPGIADRLGGLVQGNMDPAVAGLLEGSAFLAARVQVQLDDEFKTFTSELLEQLIPNYLAPTPSMMLIQAAPDFENDELAQGVEHPIGSYLDARFSDREQKISCRYQLRSNLKLFPLELTDASYEDSPRAFQSKNLELDENSTGGLILTFTRPSKKKEKAKKPISDIQLDAMPIYLAGDTGEMVSLYEQLMSNVLSVTVRHLDSNGDPKFIRLPNECIEQVGFDEDETLLPNDDRVFSGFTYLREFFCFPQKFLGIRLTHLQRALDMISADKFEIMIEFDAVTANLAPRIKADNFRIMATPAVNLFDESCSQVKIDTKRHEFLVVPDSSPSTHYEIHRIKEVFAFYKGTQTKIPVYPLYGVPASLSQERDALYFSSRPKPRRLTAQERRFGTHAGYAGTETFISIYEPADLDADDRVRRLQVKALCSNRSLPESLPINQKDIDFFLVDDDTVGFHCIAGPTSPKESFVETEKEGASRLSSGKVNWRLINYLSLNFTGILGNGQKDPAAAIKELLTLFADVSSPITERQLQGIKSLTAKPTTRSIKRQDGFHVARGTEITLTLDERAFEGTGIMLLGAVLDRFLAEYASVNSFTQTKLVSQQRGLVKSWPPRTGTGPLL